MGRGRWGSRPEEAVEAVSLLLDNWRRSRILYVTGDPIFSRYHAKDDPYIQAGLLPLREFRPEGLVLIGGPDRTTTPGPARPARGPRPSRRSSKKWAARPDTLDVDAAVTDALGVPHRGGEAAPEGRRSARRRRRRWPTCGRSTRRRLVVEPSRVRERCTTCQRITTRTAPNAACTRHNCHGTTVTEQPDEENYDVWLMGRPFVMVTAEEHTAQVPGEVRNKIEQDFKSRHGRTNCLVATPTLEMGVNIGALDMALMRNVPPRPSNYWQRAGRAGREERMAVVVTYCRRSQPRPLLLRRPAAAARRGRSRPRRSTSATR